MKTEERKNRKKKKQGSRYNERKNEKQGRRIND